MPPIGAPAQALLDDITSSFAARWVETDRATALRSGFDASAAVFTQLPAWSRLRMLASRPDWLEVYYGGDSAARQPGPGWVQASDVGAVGPPSVWLQSNATIPLYAHPGDSAATQTLPAGSLLQVQQQDPVQGRRIHVASPGNGETTLSAEGWIDTAAVREIPPPAATRVPLGFPLDLSAAVRLNVPYRGQLDGSSYAEANCGPTALGMVLQGFGVNLPPAQIRGDVLTAQGDDPGDDGAGSFVWALAAAAQKHGASVIGLYMQGGNLHRWTTADVRQQVDAGHPVILQVRYRDLPGRSASPYLGDHYIVITGVVGNEFLYNDPIGGAAAREAPGWDRVVSEQQLARAMNASDQRFAYSGFALARPGQA